VARRRKAQTRILNCEPSRDTEKDWRVPHARRARGLAAAPRLPASKDLREAWWKIGEQGSSGSCVGWAVADGVLRWHFAKVGRLQQAERLSPRFVWMASKETDQFSSRPTTFIERAGTSIKSALDIARKYGVVRETILPFASARLYSGELESFYATAALLKIALYIRLDSQSQWRDWLARNGPIATRLDVDDTWDGAKAAGGNLDVYLPETRRGGHAVSIVGYTPDRFIVRNSWGTGWGDQGFGYASLEYADDAFTEAYGVVVA
jgi:hypothetical protein